MYGSDYQTTCTISREDKKTIDDLAKETRRTKKAVLAEAIALLKAKYKIEEQRIITS